jgi:DNA-directed RNA polymerase subunit H
MDANFKLIEAVYRSRFTILDILEARGYNVEQLRSFTPDEASVSIQHFSSLGFKVTKQSTEEKSDSVTTCDVRYGSVSRQKMDKMFDGIADEDAPNTEVILIMEDSIFDATHVSALKEYMKPTKDGQRRKLRVSYFCVHNLVINPLHHVLVPKHEIVPEKDHDALMSELYITSKKKLPEIKFHIDPIARCIGAVPGDIIKITRPSISSGVTIIYRVCVP